MTNSKGLVAAMALLALGSAAFATAVPGLCFRASDVTSGRLALVYAHWRAGGGVYGVPFALVGDTTYCPRNVLRDSIVFSTPVVNPVVWTNDEQYEIKVAVAYDGVRTSAPSRIFMGAPDSAIVMIPGEVTKIVFERAAGDTSNKTVTVSALGLAAKPKTLSKLIN